MKTKTFLDQIADKFNELSDIRAVHFYGFTQLHFPPNTTGIDITIVMFQVIEQHDIVIEYTKSICRGTRDVNTHLLFVNIRGISGDFHSNVVFIDLKRGVADRFDGHGSDPDHRDHPHAFRHFYNAIRLDHVRWTFIRTTLKINIWYDSPPNDYVNHIHVTIRSLNDIAYPSHFKRQDGIGLTGDSFCHAWVSYYILLRLWNPSQPYIVIYQYLNRGHNIMEKGRKSATMISYYIQYIYMTAPLP